MTQPPLHIIKRLRRTTPNRAFAIFYICTLTTLFYHHFLTLLTSNNLLVHFAMLVSDVILAFMWSTTQAFRVCPIHREVYPKNLIKVVEENEYPALDVFICTADPYKEPPLGVVNTALSVMAYEYPLEKISVYVSDDGGSILTLFAFTEAAKFARHWLPFCMENKIPERSPEAYFKSNGHSGRSEEHRNIELMYEEMKERIESVVETGKVKDEYIQNENGPKAFKKWVPGFTRQDHPTVIEVLLESSRDKDIQGNSMPNLVYVSREKCRASPHKFKAGALNVLLRVSAAMTNAPVVLTQDCDMFSNDPQTVLQTLCYFFDPKIAPELGYIQFPQRYHNVNKNDIYASEHRRLFTVNPVGMNGLNGPSYVGTGCFFNRRAFFGGPALYVAPEIQELSPKNIVVKDIGSKPVLDMAHRVAGCNYEQGTCWGSKMGFRYGSLVEDYYTGYKLQCEGWKSVYCNPDRPAFLGDVPINLHDVLSQNKRWSVGLLEVAFSKYSPVTFGIRSMGLLMGLAYAHYAYWPIWAIPMTIYGLIPPLALLGGVSVFPKVSDPWFYVYAFLFTSAYIQDFLDFLLEGGTVRRWWNDQRMWMIRGVSSYAFGTVDYLCQSIGLSAFGFNITNKVIDDEQSKKYEKGLFEFGVSSPLFVPMTTIALLNLSAFVITLARDGNSAIAITEMILCGFVVVNCWPIYEAIALRSDEGRMPLRVTIISSLVVLGMYIDIAALLYFAA